MKPPQAPRAFSLVAGCLVPALIAWSGCAEDPTTPGSRTVLPVAPGAGADAGAGVGAGGSDAGAVPGVPPPASVDAASVSADPQQGSGGVCQQLTIEGGRVTPDRLIVLDRSSSMQGQGVDRWTPSVRGLKAITADLDDVIRFGLMAFPGRGGTTILGGGMSCAPGTLEVPIGPQAAPAIATSLDGLTLIQSTPTASTLEAAHTVLGSGAAVLDGTAVAKYVILVTDGAPNCSDPNGGRGGGGATDAAAVTASVTAIAGMQKDGIKTYVLGYDTQADPALKAALDMMAAAGGTGDTMHRAIENEASLVAEFRRITGAAASCEFALKMAPSDPNFVLVELDGQKLSLNAPDGFSLSADRLHLTVLGSACQKLQAQNEQHILNIRVTCERQTLF
jgi:hypothetical protein